MTLPHRALTDTDLLKYAKIMEIPHFRGVFMRNDLPINGPFKHESAIINLDNSDGSGTHWVAYKKINNNVIYFDSFGDLQPPLEFVSYMGVGSVKYNYKKYQNYDNVTSRDFRDFFFANLRCSSFELRRVQLHVDTREGKET